ncbi:hypothetical protein [Flavobacterium sp.]|uniref:hypothetical protein n=1 Tax=Flavobacterium sp. TaxID=239 RepID=UPI0025D07968|nr:hypothetical protein [Flavobacterium sp.]
MALIDQLNVVACSQGDLLGTGMEGCTFDWNRVATIELSPRGYAYTAEQNLANIKEGQQKGDLIILQGIKSFALVPVDPNINTADGSGYKTVTGEMPYEYDVMFDNNGVNYWKALRMLNSKDRYNVAFYDIEGNKIFTQNKAGVVKGFGVKMLFVGQYKGKEGNNPAEVKMQLQLADFSEMERQSWISGDTLDFSAESDLEGVNDVNLIASPLAIGATELVVSALLLDKSHFVDGLLASNFIVKKNNVAVAISGAVADSNAKTYTLTIPAAEAATYTVSTWDATLSTPIILSAGSGLLYKSNIATVIGD